MPSRPGVDTLERALVQYLKALKAPMTLDELRATASKGELLFLLDGLDEVIADAPWIIRAITSLASRYPNAQIVVSSRQSARIMSSVPFLGITLLDFTDDQRDQFIQHWFGRNRQRVRTLRRHLASHRAIAEVVRTPLLTTILCVLCDHGVPLPETEVRLYEERMRLLLGFYDVAKGVARLKSPRAVLEMVARKVAFGLHQEKVRVAKREIISRLAIKACEHRASATQIERAVEELIDPCNVLVPMTDDGDYGFGHLRYQEYLVAEEMLSNRAIDVSGYLSDLWWRGALVVFAQMNDSLAWLVGRVIETVRVEEGIETLTAMLRSVRSATNRDMAKLLLQHAKLDSIQDDFKTTREFLEGRWDTVEPLPERGREE